MKEEHGTVVEPSEDSPSAAFLLPLFHSVNPTHIWYRKSGENPTLIPIKEFEKMEGIIWTNSPVTLHAIRNRLFSDCEFPRQLSLTATEALCYDPSNFTIGEVNDIVGKGVFYTPQKPNEVLQQGDPIGGVYSGMLESANIGIGKKFSLYGYRVDTEKFNDENVFYKSGFGKAYYDAQHFRNLTGYIQHAPSEEKLATLDIPDELKKYIVTGNAAFSPNLHLGIPVLHAIALRDIKPGEQVFFDYGEYFDGKPYQVFDKENNVIGTINAQKQFEVNPDYKPGCTTPAVRCKPTDTQKAVDKASDKEMLLADKSSRQFIENLKFIIGLYQKKSIPGTELVFKALSDCLSDQYTPSQIHDNVHDIAIGKDLLAPFPELHLLKQELSIYFKLHGSALILADSEKEKLNAKTKKSWDIMDIDRKLCFCLFGRKTELRKIKQDSFSGVATTIKYMHDQDALIVCFSQLLLQNKLNEEKAAQAQARKAGKK